MKKLSLLLLCALVALLTGCSETTKTAETKKEPEKAAALEPVTGQSGLYKMYQVARSWASDAQVLKMNSLMLNEAPNAPRGKAAAWQATFVSAAKSQSKTYTWSSVESEGNLHKGVFGGPDEGWSGPRGNNQPALVMAVKIDTPAALETALKEGADYEKKNPGKPINFVLEKTPKHPNPVWRVLWGESVGTSNFSILVDASTGEFREKLR
jgi:hypothetical protein